MEASKSWGSRLARRTLPCVSAYALLALAFCVTPAPAQSGSASSTPSTFARKESAQPAATQKSDRISALRAQIDEATDKQERARLQRTLVDYLIALNRKSEALTELRAMARDDRVDAVGFYNIGNALARLGDTDTAIEAYRKAISQRRGKYARALNNLGVVLIRQQRWDEAIEALSSALKQENSRYGEASYNLGRVYAARGQLRLAIDEWTRVLSLQPDHMDAALALARAYAADGNPDRGIRIIDEFVARQGPNKALIEARNEILRSKAGTGQRSHALAPEAANEPGAPDATAQPS